MGRNWGDGRGHSCPHRLCVPVPAIAASAKLCQNPCDAAPCSGGGLSLLRKTELAGEDVGSRMSHGAGGTGIRSALNHCCSAWLPALGFWRARWFTGSQGDQREVPSAWETGSPSTRKWKKLVTIPRDIQLVGCSQLCLLGVSFLLPLSHERTRKMGRGGERGDSS